MNKKTVQASNLKSIVKAIKLHQKDKKKMSNGNNLQIAYERTRTGMGMEAGTAFIDYEFKF